MSIRPLAFGVRLRDKDRTLRVRANEKQPGRYLVEDSRDGGRSRKREHTSLTGALRDAAASWRNRLN
jgi:hypothetical protein